VQGIRAFWHVSAGGGLHVPAHLTHESVAGSCLSALRARVLSSGAVLRDEACEASNTVSVLLGRVLPQREGASAWAGSGCEL